MEAEVLYQKLEEIKTLIRKNENSDGTCCFEADAVCISLDLTREMLCRTIKDKTIEPD